ncbi:XRE family transcriptional regulator [Staphylococcus saprophyticus]|uniref:helix-turn-helix domain-containing protein n=1 Tax=Staphylococcus saprophyticus TaxID=29385 RepID=UPI001013CE83|nr:helix-turn-helix transcriptional regulator [Staphylococcus saprophyticus]RXS04266.1 XRE family transcriptional regulator [Staphylococcus saprophyticus]
MYDKKLVGERIKNIRLQSGKTQEAFGEIFSASKGNVAMWEKGKSLPNAERLKKISKFGNISVNQLLYGDFLMLLENMTREKINEILEYNFLEGNKDIYDELMSSASGLIISFYERGSDSFDPTLFNKLLEHYLQLELDLGDRDLESLTYFAYQKTMNAQELVVDYYEDSKAQDFLENEEIKEFLFTISDKYFELMKYIDDYREKHNLEKLSEE